MKKKDIIKRKFVSGREMTTGIRLDGVTKTLTQWSDMQECEMSVSGLRKRIAANQKKHKDDPTRLTPWEIVFLPTRGNGHTGEIDRVKVRLQNNRTFEIDSSFSMIVAKQSWFPIPGNGVAL